MVYKAGQMVVLIEPVGIRAMYYSKFLDMDEYPIGTQFMVHSVYEEPNSYKLQLVVDGKIIPQDGRTDRTTIGIPTKSFKLFSKRRALLSKLKDFS